MLAVNDQSQLIALTIDNLYLRKATYQCLLLEFNVACMLILGTRASYIRILGNLCYVAGLNVEQEILSENRDLYLDSSLESSQSDNCGRCL